MKKIFYPSHKLNTSHTPRAKSEIGKLAYYEPWEDVVIFFDIFSSSGSLYGLGEAITGIGQLADLSGTARIGAAE